MQFRRLGSTGISVSSIGFGGVPLSRIGCEEAVRVLHRAFDRGVTLVDTARSYGDSEIKIGKALPGREGVVLASKSQATDAEGMARHIRESLARLDTDHIHLYQCHDLREGYLEQITAPGGAMEALVKAREEGLIGHIGVSGHRPGLLGPAIESGLFETIQVPLNVVDYPLFREAIPAAVKHDLGIIVMKPLCGGLMESVTTAFRFVLQHPVSSAIPGMASLEEVDENTAVGAEEPSFTEKEMEQLNQEARQLGHDFCRRCGYCQPCPVGLDIPDILRFDRYYVSYFTKEWARDQYRESGNWVEDCLDCGECEDRCPYDLPIREKLRQAHERLAGEGED